MKEVAPHDRPREKLERLGPAALGDNELVALVLGSGARGRDVLELANAVLEECGGLHGLTRAAAADLLRITGVGGARAAQVLAAVELGRRTLVRVHADRPRLNTPRQLASYLLPQHGSRPVEQFGIVMLDTKHRLLQIRLVSTGSLDSTVAHPREVFREAIAGRAAAIVLFHNHPSGDPRPSADDLALTARLAEAGQVVGIDVLDHLILADQRYYSFMEAGQLPRGEG
ncbi:MAG TPA: DNA repair protein RadC [Vicinamibacterales bacterium]|jgi:DNA repair protein RadC|nr:DNA repair protein RadC [Vicinamibacterales bacterium]